MDGTVDPRVLLQSSPPPPEGRSAWEQLRERLDKVTPADVEECVALFQMLEHAQRSSGLKKWASLQGYFGAIPRCVRAVGGKPVREMRISAILERLER
ncbi:hypothetical protein PTE30175_03509 [Pandoraea terrae]|uniref:Uncharacterized protein n=1 Tax=Pandoraea terrae TaxID=1537710 RepID=A0A5E4X1D0_9BURK|nr:hypothetical protein [Pandoraea terrae]VVE30097.1 hypothetical protein PTE30175_03509 [Pandoraea terrae]